MKTTLKTTDLYTIAFSEADLDRLFAITDFVLNSIEHPDDRDAVTSLRNMFMQADWRNHD